MRRWTLIVAILLAGLLALQIASDRTAPITGIGTVEGLLLRIVPRVSGELVRVEVTDNAIVEPGTTLVEIDPTPFRLAVEAAEAELARVGQSIGASTADVAAAQAKVAEAEAALINANAQTERMFELVARGVMPAARGDEATAAVATAEAALAAAEAGLSRAEEALGPLGADNPQFRAAQSALETAQFNLTQTTHRRPDPGVVSNLKLGPGRDRQRRPAAPHPDRQPGRLGRRLLSREPAREHPGRRPARITLDVLPGQVFPGRVQSFSAGVMTVNQSAQPRRAGAAAPQRHLDDLAAALRGPRRVRSARQPGRAVSASARRRPSWCRPSIRLGCGRSGPPTSGSGRISPMSTEAENAQLLRVALITPLVLGVAVSGLELPLAFFAPMLFATLALKLPAPPPLPVAVVLLLLFYLVPSLVAGLAAVFSEHLHLMLGFVGLALFLAFRMQAAPRTAAIGALLQIFAILVPVLSQPADALGRTVADAFGPNALLAIGGLYLAFALFPAPPGSRAAPAPAPMDPPADLTRAAALSTLVILPLIALVLVLQLTSAIRVLMTVAIVLAALFRRTAIETGAEILHVGPGGGGVALAFTVLQKIWALPAALVLALALLGLIVLPYAFAAATAAPSPSAIHWCSSCSGSPPRTPPRRP